MFYCPLHNWYSTEEPCKACFTMKTETVTDFCYLPKLESTDMIYTEEDMRKCFYAPIHIDGGGRADTFEDYLKTIKRQL